MIDKRVKVEVYQFAHFLLDFVLFNFQGWQDVFDESIFVWEIHWTIQSNDWSRLFDKG